MYDGDRMGVWGRSPPPYQARAAENFGIFGGSRGRFHEKTALPVWQPQTAKLGHFFAQHFIVAAKKKAFSGSLKHISFPFNGGIITVGQQASF